MSEIIKQSLNDSVEICIEMESIGDCPIVQDGLVSGTVKQFWIQPISELPKGQEKEHE